jgi:FAD/FMN-containing dehydrogenase
MPSPVTDQDILAGYLEDASRMHGHAASLYRPTDEVELATILSHLNEEKIPVTVVAEQTSTTGTS